MGWYKVTKKIRGQLYDYLQQTKRVGKTTKTENRYIGKSSKGKSFTPMVLSKRERAQDETIQYSSLKVRIARQNAKIRAAKRSVRGIKHINPFIAKLAKVTK